MNLASEFAVPYPPERVWRIIGNPRKVALCLPDAVVESENDDTYKGRATVSVGPISLALTGQVIVLERHDSDRRMTLKITAEERYGHGTVVATMIVSASASAIGADVKADAAVQLSGKIAQFSGPLIASMSNSIMRKFAKKLEALVAAETTRPAVS